MIIDAHNHPDWHGHNLTKFLENMAKGNIIKRGRLPGLIDHLVVSKYGKVLATTSGGQVALYTASQ